MTRCMFLGHKDIYDIDLKQRLAQAVQGIVEENGTVEFLFYRRGFFYDACLLAVLDAKKKYPGKVSIVLVVPASQEDEFTLHLERHDGLLPWYIDKVIAPPSSVPNKYRYGGHEIKGIEHWMFLYSTYLIQYYYRYLYEQNGYLYTHAARQGLRILDITNRETDEAIQDSIRHLTGQERLILQMLVDGVSIHDTEYDFHRTSLSIRGISFRIGKFLKRYAKNRMRAQRQKTPILKQ